MVYEFYLNKVVLKKKMMVRYSQNWTYSTEKKWRWQLYNLLVLGEAVWIFYFCNFKSKINFFKFQGLFFFYWNHQHSKK